MRSGSVVVPGWSPDGNAQFPVISANMDVSDRENRSDLSGVSIDIILVVNVFISILKRLSLPAMGI